MAVKLGDFMAKLPPAQQQRIEERGAEVWKKYLEKRSEVQKYGKSTSRSGETLTSGLEKRDKS